MNVRTFTDLVHAAMPFNERTVELVVLAGDESELVRAVGELRCAFVPGDAAELEDVTALQFLITRSLRRRRRPQDGALVRIGRERFRSALYQDDGVFRITTADAVVTVRREAS